MSRNKVGVIGAGQMGTGIAEVCAEAGFDVYFMDVDEDRLAHALKIVEEDLGKLVEKGRLSSEFVRAALGRIATGTDYEGFRDCHIAIEAAVEDEAVRSRSSRSCARFYPTYAIITTNTSTLSITRLAAQTDRPGRFLGTHFMNPVPKMELVELIRGITTDEDTYRELHDFATQIGRSRSAPRTSPRSSSTAS